MDDDGSNFFPKQKVRKLYNEKYQKLIQIDIMFKKIIKEKYKNTSDIFRKKMKGNRLCVYKRFNVS